MKIKTALKKHIHKINSEATFKVMSLNGINNAWSTTMHKIVIPQFLSQSRRLFILFYSGYVISYHQYVTHSFPVKFQGQKIDAYLFHRTLLLSTKVSEGFSVQRLVILDKLWPCLSFPCTASLFWIFWKCSPPPLYWKSSLRYIARQLFSIKPVV